MRIPIRKFALAVAVASLAIGSSSQAVMIDGSISFGSAGVTLLNGTDLSNTSLLRIDSFAGINSVQAGSRTGDFTIIPLGTPFTPATLDLNNLSGFGTTSVSFGGFDAASGLVLTQPRVPNFLDVLLQGIYSDLPGFDDTPASIRFSFNQSGGSVSAAITLNSPPEPAPAVAPEPSTLVSALLGVPIAGGLWLRRRRKTT